LDKKNEKHTMTENYLCVALCFTGNDIAARLLCVHIAANAIPSGEA
jgi:hypothetical protein